MQKIKRNAGVFSRAPITKWLEAHNWEAIEKITYDVETQVNVTSNAEGSNKNMIIMDVIYLPIVALGDRGSS